MALLFLELESKLIFQVLQKSNDISQSEILGWWDTSKQKGYSHAKRSLGEGVCVSKYQKNTQKVK